MSLITIDAELSNPELEKVLLAYLCTGENRYEVAKQCLPAMFLHPTVGSNFNGQPFNRMIFKDIRLLHCPPPDKLMLHFLTRKSNLNYAFLLIYAKSDIFENKEVLSMATHDIAPVVKSLKQMMFRRQQLELTEQMAGAIELADQPKYANLVVKQLNLQRFIGKDGRSSNDEIAERTARSINTDVDILKTGWSPIDSRFYGLTRNAISSLLAMPKNFKSSLADFVISGAVEKFGHRGLIISLEDSVEQRLTRMLASRHDISLEDIRFKKVKVEVEQIRHLLDITLHGKLHILDQKDVFTPDEAVIAIMDIKPDFCIIDHIQKFSMPDMVQGLIKAVGAIERATKVVHAHTMILSQVPDKQFKSRDTQQPQASDGQWTSVLRQSSAEMFSLSYPHQESKNPSDVGILKFSILAGRFASALGTFTLFIDPDKAKIIEELKPT